MNALLNHVPIPFFDRIPPRAKAAYISVFDGVVDMAWPVESAYRHFTNSLITNDIDGPNFKEFTDWYWRVRRGLVERPHSSEIYCAAEDGRVQPNPYQPSEKQPDERSLAKAVAIVKAARSLFEAQLKAGYAPPTLHGDDEIIADALREVLGAKFGTALMDANVHLTPGNKVVDLLLGEASVEIDTKLFECLTMTMQPELCAILARQGFTASN
ncbi:hypothetical protein [Brucella pseudogrignonensis]|uniref:hypothetical protein n=1 Tax=Brucella pseudogrignonensis TaxID=419475 RepID=UPI003ECCD102